MQLFLVLKRNTRRELSLKAEFMCGNRSWISQIPLYHESHYWAIFHCGKWHRKPLTQCSRFLQELIKAFILSLLLAILGAKEEFSYLQIIQSESFLKLRAGREDYGDPTSNMFHIWGHRSVFVESYKGKSCLLRVCRLNEALLNKNDMIFKMSACTKVIFHF